MADEHFIDQEARDLAKEAAHKIDAHEDVCAERWRSANDSLLRVEKTIRESVVELQIRTEKALNAVYGILWKSAIGVIGALIGLLYIVVPKLF